MFGHETVRIGTTWCQHDKTAFNNAYISVIPCCGKHPDSRAARSLRPRRRERLATIGPTAWDRCFWVNNVGVIAGAVMFLVWLAGMMLGFRVVWPLWLRLLGYR